MESKDYKSKECIFCGYEYTVTHHFDNGIDYHGHNRGNHREWDDDEGCPRCGDDIVKAAEFVKQQRIEVELKKEALRTSLGSKYLSKSYYYFGDSSSISHKGYPFLSDDNKCGIYYYYKDDEIVYCYMESEKIDSNLSLSRLEWAKTLKTSYAKEFPLVKLQDKVQELIICNVGNIQKLKKLVATLEIINSGDSSDILCRIYSKCKGLADIVVKGSETTINII